MPVLPDVLARLGIAQYQSVLHDNGFSTWNSVLDISEEDFNELGFKLGHRRLLQREIATFRGVPSSLSLEPNDATGSCSPSPLESPPVPTSTPRAREGKRRYRRHARPDTNAPKKPKTAYVNFADHLRTDPVVSALSFVDIAKEVGRRWQVLPPDSKRRWESEAAHAMQDYEAQMDEYKRTESYRNYQVYLEDFRAQQARANAMRRAATTVRQQTPDNVKISRGSPMSASDSPRSLPSCSGTDSDNCDTTLPHAMSELVSLRRELLASGAQPYHPTNLPTENLMRRAMYAFVTGTGSLMYMWSYTQVDDLLNRLYRPETDPDSMTVAECFIVAAMGAHYDADSFPDSVRQALYVSSTLQFEERVAKVDYLRTMRLLLSMALYSLLEKHMSARYLVAAGLQIGRWRLPQLNEYSQEAEGDNWRRIFRSLVFMDCWLSYTLGYQSEITAEDVALSNISYVDPSHVNEAIHYQASQIGLVAAEVAKTMSHPSLITRENVMMLADKLGIWRSRVPLALRLSTLTSGQPSDLTLYQRRATLMVHTSYLGALILLYRQLLTVGEEAQQGTNSIPFKPSAEEIKKYREECAIAAQQMARILGLISFDGTLTKRCWLVIYWSYTASTILLSTAVTKMLAGDPNGIQEDLTHAKDCLSNLQLCAADEPLAARYAASLSPVYDALRNVHNRTIGRAKTSIFSLLQPSDPNQLSPPIPVSRAEVGGLEEMLGQMVLDPFGRREGNSAQDERRRRVIGADGGCTVFWWR